MPNLMLRGALAALGLLCLASSASAYPRYFWDINASGFDTDPSGGSCSLHPSDADVATLAKYANPPYFSPHMDAPIKADP